ncbi:hypothetical protein AVEN_22318-1 [Araneus ventricosus]|uniref:Uncharacterized protein n=1 Tax=Araneus ventricosus TaxID=182803 RepID=A0A4Y2VH62_ARAVE|nr:hypothetical protein AVEN_22318-1 [Araneus ventricosus]
MEEYQSLNGIFDLLDHLEQGFCAVEKQPHWNSNFAVSLRQFSSVFTLTNGLAFCVPKNVEWSSGECPAYSLRLDIHERSTPRKFDLSTTKQAFDAKTPMRIGALWSEIWISNQSGSAVVTRTFGDGVPVQESSSSSDRGSEL